MYDEYTTSGCNHGMGGMNTVYCILHKHSSKININWQCPLNEMVKISIKWWKSINFDKIDKNGENHEFIEFSSKMMISVILYKMWYFYEFHNYDNFMNFMIKNGVINLIEKRGMSKCRKRVKNVQKWPNQKRLWPIVYTIYIPEGDHTPPF